MRHCRRRGCEESIALHEFDYALNRVNERCLKCGMPIIGDENEQKCKKPKTILQKILELFK